MNGNRTTKKVFNAQTIGIRRKCRENLRWIDGLEKRLLVLKTLARKRLALKKLLEGPPMDLDPLRKESKDANYDDEMILKLETKF
ncbi:hypothetical protein TNCV_936111 [Trichonephila clavipes]|nr:hypothetical protein TNCV_936111 [Trichonephila clavipes]